MADELTPELIALGEQLALLDQFERDLAWEPEVRPLPLRDPKEVPLGHTAFMGDFDTPPQSQLY